MSITISPKVSTPTARPLRFERQTPQAEVGHLDSFVARPSDEAEPPSETDPTPPTDPNPPTDPEPQPPAEVGTKREFFVWDMSVMPPETKSISTTCRAVGENTNIFVDDAVWERLVTEEDIFELERRLESRAPSGAVDPRQGIAAINHAYFGEPPVGMDGDPKVNVLVTEFASFRGTVMDGYFNVFDTMTDEQAQQYGQRSNQTEVIYLNAASRRISSDYMQGVLAHEYQHLLHHPYDPDEESWLGETLGEVAMKVNGYHTDMGHVARHQTRPDRPLVSQTYVDYGACMLFGTYLTEQFGQGFIQELSQNPENGVASINSSLQALGQDQNFDSLYRNWVVANYADARGVATPGLHYATLDVPAPAETVVESREFSEQSTLRPTGARYYKLPEGELQLSLSSEQEGLTAEILEFDGKKMRRLPVDGEVRLDSHSDRVLCLGSLATEEISYELRLG